MHYLQITGAAIAVLVTSATAQNCRCYWNQDTAWFTPPGGQGSPPASVVRELCASGGGCVSGYGRFCVLGNVADCDCLSGFVEGRQSWDGSHWRFPSAIQCGKLSGSVTQT